VSPEAPNRKATAAFNALNSPVMQKGKRRRQTPLYFRTRKSTRIKQGKPQISTKIPIEIEDSPTPRDKEEIMRDQLERENACMRGHLLEKENQLAYMASLSLEAIQCRMPAKSYALYLREQWLQFQIKTIAQRGTMPF